MTTIVNTKLGENRGKKRIWLEGAKIAREGYRVGQRFDIQVSHEKVTMTLNEVGQYKVSKRTRKEEEMPIIDVNNAEITDTFANTLLLRVVINRGTIVITSHHQQTRAQERLDRLSAKIKEGTPLDVCSLFHGGGILDKAIHHGLANAGIKTTIALAVELESKYLESSLRNNTELWNPKSIVIHAPIESVDLSRTPPQVDIVVAGIPCTGASKAGRSKNQNWGDTAGGFAESHSSAGALFFNFLQFITVLNPSVIVIENVPEYQNTASMEVIASVLTSLKYTIQMRVLDSSEFGVLEKRKRLCVVAMTEGLEGFDLGSVSSEPKQPPAQGAQKVKHILDDIDLESPRWKEFDYIRIKQERDIAAGKGFKRQLITGDETHLGTIGKDYAKCRSTEPFIVHPHNSNKSRLLTPVEHCRVKGVPVSAIAGESDTTAHQILGQSVCFPVFEQVAFSLGFSLLGQCALRSQAA